MPGVRQLDEGVVQVNIGKVTLDQRASVMWLGVGLVSASPCGE